MTTAVSEIAIRTSAAQIYQAFTNATALRQWLCDVATVSAQPRGRMYLWWNGDFYSSGVYIEVEPDKSLKFRWHSNIDPAATEVLVSIEETDGNTLVRMAHTVPNEPEWEKLLAGFKSNWDSSLENLKSVLETGIDQRIANRPMLGFMPGDFTQEQAKHLGVPTTEGLRLDGVLDGMGAAAAGLQKDDVIVGLDGKTIGSDFGSFRNAIAGKKGGDSVEVVFYRGAEKKQVRMELSRRPMIEVPFNPTELARQGRANYEAVLAELEQCFSGVSDEQARTRPAEGEWSALDTLAHLLQGERANQAFIVEFLDGYVRQADGFGSNQDAIIRATTSVYGSIEAMMNALRNSIEENLNLTANLPESFAENKGSFYQVGSVILQSNYHYYTHLPQIKAALKPAS